MMPGFFVSLFLIYWSEYVPGGLPTASKKNTPKALSRRILGWLYVPVFHVPHTTIFGTPHYQLLVTLILPKIRTCTDKIATPRKLFPVFIFAHASNCFQNARTANADQVSSFVKCFVIAAKWHT